MTLGETSRQPGLFKSTAYVAERVPGNSIWALLARHGERLFPDEMFADLFSARGRRSVPPRVVATVMVLQRLHGLSDREAVAAFEWDARWKFACGGLDYDAPGFVHTVLVSMRARLARSERPRRIFEATLGVAREAKLLSAQRVLDSTPLYDAVATQDTVTLLRSSVRGLLREAERLDASGLGAELRAVLRRDDDYRAPGKPPCDWEDREAARALIDELATDVSSCLRVLEQRELDERVARAGELCAAVVGQDLEQDDGGRFVIARRVAKDRIISTVDPDARHGRKSSAHGFDGYKGHLAIDPESELITHTTVTAGNVADGDVAEELIADLLEDAGGHDVADEPAAEEGGGETPTVYGDSAYGSGAFQEVLEEHGIESRCRTRRATTSHHGFSKERFTVDLERGTVTCPAEVSVPIRRASDGSGTAYFRGACGPCPLRSHCTTSPMGRTVQVGVHEASLAAARARQETPGWLSGYRTVRSIVERKVAHTTRRRHGGRVARVRGRLKVDADHNLLAASVNLARLATLGLHSTPTRWAVAAPS